MKKLIVSLAALATLALPVVAFATPSSVDRIVDHIEPLIKTDYIQAQFFHATSTTASSTLQNTEVNQLKIDALNGLLKAVNGFVVTSLVNLATDVTGVLLTANGGTGTSSPSGILYGDNGATNHLNTVSIGSNLTFSGGILSASGGSGGGSGNVATSTSETTEYVPFYTSTAGTPATIGADSNFFWNNTNKRLGLASTTPTQLLSVGGNVIIGASTAGGTNGTLTYGNVTFANTVTGTGSLVGSASPVFTSVVIAPTLRGGSAVTTAGVLTSTNQVTPTTATLTLGLTSGAAGYSKLAFGIQGLAFGTTTSAGAGTFDIASSSTSSTFKPQFFITDSAAGTNLKHWAIAAEGGEFSISTTSDLFASSTVPALKINTSGQITLANSLSLPGILTLSALGTPAGTFLAADPTGKLIATTSPTGTVSSVGLSDANSTLTIGSTPVTTSGTITATLNLAHSNFWSVLQSFAFSSTTLASVTSKLYVGGTSTTTIDSVGNVVLPSAASLTVTGLGVAAGTFLAADPTGKLIATTSPTAGISGSGATGQATFWTGTSAVSGDNGFFWDNTNKFLGIGTTSPFSVLTALDTSTTTNAFSIWQAVTATSTMTQTFTSTGTWTKPSGFLSATVTAVGGGGGGGRADGFGGGGGGGSSNFAATTPCIAAGGGGGAGVTNVGTAPSGSAGGTGGTTIAGSTGGAGGGADREVCTYAVGGISGSTVTVSIGQGGQADDSGGGAGGTGFFAGGRGGGTTGGGGGGGGSTGAGAAAAGNTGGAGGTGASSGGVKTSGTNGVTTTGGASGDGTAGGSPGNNGSNGSGGGTQNGGNSGVGGNGYVVVTSVVLNTTPQFALGVTSVMNGYGNTEPYVGIGTSTPMAKLTVLAGSSTPPFAIASSLITDLVGTVVNYVWEQIDIYGHLETGGPAPTAASCSGFAITGDDRTGKVSFSTAASCSINFAHPWRVVPICVANSDSVLANIRISAISTAAVTFAASTNITDLDYICQAHH